MPSGSGVCTHIHVCVLVVRVVDSMKTHGNIRVPSVSSGVQTIHVCVGVRSSPVNKKGYESPNKW